MHILDGVVLVSWDVDGTLYDHKLVKRELARAAVRSPLRAGLELLPARAFHLGAQVLRRRGADVRPLANRLNRPQGYIAEANWAGPVIARIGARPGVKRVLGFVRSRGIRQVAFSDYRSGYKLNALGLDGYFAGLYAAEQLGALKPAPTGFEAICRDFRVPPDAVLHIGDRVSTDERAARSAGIRCLILGRDFESFIELATRIDPDPAL